MSMKVDLNTPLSDEEREYLLMRGRMGDIQRVDGLHNTEAPPFPSGDGTGPQQRPLLTSEDRAGERQRLLDRLAEIDAETGGEEDGDEYPELAPYQEWTPKELDAELGRRGLSKSGNKQDKVDRLYQDDDKAAQTQEQPPV